MSSNLIVVAPQARRPSQTFDYDISTLRLNQQSHKPLLENDQHHPPPAYSSPSHSSRTPISPTAYSPIPSSPQRHRPRPDLHLSPPPPSSPSAPFLSPDRSYPPSPSQATLIGTPTSATPSFMSAPNDKARASVLPFGGAGPENDRMAAAFTVGAGAGAQGKHGVGLGFGMNASAPGTPTVGVGKDEMVWTRVGESSTSKRTDIHLSPVTEPSPWLSKQTRANSKLKILTWLTALVILIAIGAGIGYHFVHQKPPEGDGALKGVLSNDGPEGSRATNVASAPNRVAQPSSSAPTGVTSSTVGGAVPSQTRSGMGERERERERLRRRVGTGHAREMESGLIH